MEYKKQKRNQDGYHTYACRRGRVRCRCFVFGLADGTTRCLFGHEVCPRKCYRILVPLEKEYDSHVKEVEAEAEEPWDEAAYRKQWDEEDRADRVKWQKAHEARERLKQAKEDAEKRKTPQQRLEERRARDLEQQRFAAYLHNYESNILP